MKKKVSVLIPVYNEQKTIIKALLRLNESKDKRVIYEIIVINDGSTDKSLELLKTHKNLFDELITYNENKGKGYAIKSGLSIATGDYIFFQDADLEYDPNDFEEFINLYLNFDADCVIGSRFIYKKFTRSHIFFNKLGNKFITFMFNLLYNTTFTDIYSCYGTFKKSLINPDKLKYVGWEQHMEILTNVVKKGKKFYEVPISYNGRNIDEGKKIRYYHIFSVIKVLIFNKFKD